MKESGFIFCVARNGGKKGTKGTSTPRSSMMRPARSERTLPGAELFVKQMRHCG